jgi:hypothetical protein
MVQGYDSWLRGVMAKARARRDDEDDDENGDKAQARRVARDAFPEHEGDRQNLVDWLLARPGRLRRLRQVAREQRRRDEDGEDPTRYELRQRKALTMPDRSEVLRSIVKQAGGVAALVKRIVRDGSSDGISEHELTAEIQRAAVKAWPDLSPEQAFTKMFESPAGEPLRRAVAIAKAGLMPVMPTQVGGADVDVDDPAEALGQIKQLIARMRAASPDLTESDAWDRVVRSYPRLARRAIPIPAPGMAHAYPWR